MALQLAVVETPGLVARLHVERARLYATLARLLSGELTESVVADLREPLLPSHHPAARLILHTVEGATADGLRATREHLTARHLVEWFCEPSFASVRDEARRIAGVTSGLGRVGELEILAALSARTAEAAIADDAEAVRELHRVQRRFLGSHAKGCLEELGAELASSGAGVFGLLGVALASLLADSERIS